MKNCLRKLVLVTGTSLLHCSNAAAQTYRVPNTKSSLETSLLQQRYYGNDVEWYKRNVPTLEIDDAAIQETYFYRWKLYRSHLRELGRPGIAMTEFLPSVGWSRHPWEDLNDSASFQIREGRWQRDRSQVASFVDHEYADAGNDRHFSEWIAAATLDWVMVTGDAAPALRNLAAMRYVYSAWDDHYDASRGMYWVEPLYDATEYTISSIDASGAGFDARTGPDHTGFTGGYAFRPSINSYQYGNARAIAAFAGIAGLTEIKNTFNAKADALRVAMLSQLWNPSLAHFTDIYQRSTDTVKVGDFIRGRELVGMVPWMFHVPPSGQDGITIRTAWKHVLDSNEFAGAFGLRTNEPSYPRYLVQYAYAKGTTRPECQWNGPSWPFQTSQVLTGMATALQQPDHEGLRNDDFVHLLRQYTAQHRRPDGVLDLQEDYNPDTGAAIVGLPRSHHYSHSTYVDLILGGLIGIRPDLGDTLTIAPLLPTPHGSEKPIRFFALYNLLYHAHNLTVFYDSDGSRYHHGVGLRVYVDGRMAARSGTAVVTVRLQHRSVRPAAAPDPDLAVNVWGRQPTLQEPLQPIATASSTEDAQQLYEPLDGRLWFFPEVPHGWSPATTPAEQQKEQQFTPEDWYGVDLRRSFALGTVRLAFFEDGQTFRAPSSVHLQIQRGSRWFEIDLPHTVPVENGITTLRLTGVTAQRLRVRMRRQPGSKERLIAFRVYPASPAAGH